MKRALKPPSNLKSTRITRWTKTCWVSLVEPESVCLIVKAPFVFIGSFDKIMGLAHGTSF